ncbi:MAG: hypothetical protein LBH43_06190 [Treponema sp.]|jgi:hypothetical protein|nr:hypothetical protein [Treponema sp.]
MLVNTKKNKHGECCPAGQLGVSRSLVGAFSFFSVKLRETLWLNSYLLICLLTLFFYFASCSRTEPVISYGFISLNLFQDGETPQERLCFFIIAEDEDGIENLDDLYLYHDREQLRWQLKSEDWITYSQDGKTWIGSRSLAMESGESFPRGQYRAVLINKGGERSQKNFSFDAPEESRYPFPSLEISDGVYTVDSSYPENRFICYDNQGNYISSLKLIKLSGNVSDLTIPQNARSVALWAEDPLYFTSALTNVASLR